MMMARSMKSIEAIAPRDVYAIKVCRHSANVPICTNTTNVLEANLRGDECGRGSGLPPCCRCRLLLSPLALPVLRCPSIHSLIDITPKQLNHEACCCRPLRHLGRRLRPLAGSCCCKCTCCINFAFWILPLSLCSPASSASCLVDGFVFSLASH